MLNPPLRHTLMLTDPAVLFENVSHAFGAQQVLQGVSLRIEQGEIVGLIGPNGAGKSTLLRSMVGIIRPDHGTVQVCGTDAVRNALEARRHIGYAPSETALYHQMTSEQLLAFAIAFHPSADHALGLSLLDKLGVPHAKRLGALSHGMKRKIMLVQAIACGGPVIVLDEPTEALDPEARRMVESELRSQAAAGRAVLFSSHDLTSVERLCHRAAFLRRGTIVRAGGAAELAAETGRLLHLEFRVPMDRDQLPVHAAWRWQGQATRWSLHHNDPVEKVLAVIAELPINGIRDGGGSLEEVFDALYGGDAA